MAIYLASFTRKYSKIYTYKKVYIKAGWQPSDKFSPDSLIHSTTFRRKNPRIPETRVPSQRWQLKKSRENARVLHANVLIPPPLPSRNSNHLHKRWFLAARQPRVITLWKCAKDGGKRGGGKEKKKSRQRIAWKRMVERWSTSDAPRDELVIRKKPLDLPFEPSNVSIPTSISIEGEREGRKKAGIINQPFVFNSFSLSLSLVVIREKQKFLRCN